MAREQSNERKDPELPPVYWLYLFIVYQSVFPHMYVAALC